MELVDSVDDDEVAMAVVLVMFFVRVLGSKEYVALVPAVVLATCSSSAVRIGVCVLPIGNVELAESLVPVPIVGSGAVPLLLDGSGPKVVVQKG